jgi:hypothetical protein
MKVLTAVKDVPSDLKLYHLIAVLMIITRVVNHSYFPWSLAIIFSCVVASNGYYGTMDI